MSQRKTREKELAELKHRINAELTMMKAVKFPKITDREFEDVTGVSRASLPGVETGKSWPRLDTMYLWVTACGASLAELFRSPSGQYDDQTRDIHRSLELILRSEGPKHWLVQAIASEHDRLRPPDRSVKASSRGSPNQLGGQEDGTPAGSRNTNSRKRKLA